MSAAAPEVHPLIRARWSPPQFNGEPLPPEALACMLEAARWAPSADNSQPWRFVYALPGSAAWAQFQRLPRPVNRALAASASALLLLVSRTEHGGKALHAHAFDAGAACAQLALQAAALGWQAHAMGGFDRPLARDLLQVPEAYAVQLLLAIGRSTAPRPTGERLPLAALAAEGHFRFNDA